MIERPRVGEPEIPPLAHALVHRDFNRVVEVGPIARRIQDFLSHECSTRELVRVVVQDHIAAIVGGAQVAVRTRIATRNLHGVSAVRPQHVDAGGLCRAPI